MPAATMYLPGISEVDDADGKLGSLLSDLDVFVRATEQFSGDDIPLEEALFLDKSGIAFENAPRHVDPAVIARLLVFAEEALDDAEKIRDQPESLRSALLSIYRNYVIERLDRRSGYAG